MPSKPAQSPAVLLFLRAKGKPELPRLDNLSPATVPRGGGELILVVDDDLFREALACTLTERGYKVMQAPDGELGMKLFRAEPTDLVITDTRGTRQERRASVAA